MKLLNYLEEKKIPFVYNGTIPNQLNVNPYLLSPNKDGAQEFNTIYKLALESDLSILERTKSGAIANNKLNKFAYDIRHSNNGGLITIFAYGRLYSIKLGHWAINDQKNIHPFLAFSLFRSKCEEYDIDLDDYAIENGEEIKKDIPKPYIYFDEDILNKTLYNVHHIDFHNSYPAGLVNTHPEFRPIVEFFYNNRKDHPEFKAVLNYTIGMMQSLKVKSINARWAHLSRDAIQDNNNRIDKLATELVMSGRKVLGENTDGIWYQGEIFHGENEGSCLGRWENDHVRCKFRAKSHGAYEYVENKKYTPVVRGMTAYDKEVPRELWNWGDIYKSSVYVLDWNDESGFIISEVE